MEGPQACSYHEFDRGCVCLCVLLSMSVSVFVVMPVPMSVSVYVSLSVSIRSGPLSWACMLFGEFRWAGRVWPRLEGDRYGSNTAITNHHHDEHHRCHYHSHIHHHTSHHSQRPKVLGPKFAFATLGLSHAVEACLYHGSDRVVALGSVGFGSGICTRALELAIGLVVRVA